MMIIPGRPGFLQLWPTSNDTRANSALFFCQVSYFSTRIHMVWWNHIIPTYRSMGAFQCLLRLQVSKAYLTWLNLKSEQSHGSMHNLHNPSSLDVAWWATLVFPCNEFNPRLTPWLHLWHISVPRECIELTFALLSFLLKVLILAFPAFNLFLEVFEVP